MCLFLLPTAKKQERALKIFAKTIESLKTATFAQAAFFK